MYPNDAVIELSGDCTAGETDTALLIPSGRRLTIDLKGYAIDRALLSASLAKENGCVIRNNGTLTIADTAGGRRHHRRLQRRQRRGH